MQELDRDVYSGAMTKRLKQQPMQDKLFPAEDIITVQNLLTRPATDMFRGPSRKLLSFHILVGDSYILPSTLNRYGQDLLAKVDADIRRKSPQGKGPKSHLIEKEEVGEICHRVFYEVDVRSPESPERMYGEGASIFDTDGIELLGDSVSKTEFRSSTEPNLSPADSLSDTFSPLIAVSKGSVGQREAAPVSRNDTPPSRPSAAKLQLRNVSETQDDAIPTLVAVSSLPGQLKNSSTESLPFRKLSRIGNSNREFVPGNSPRAIVSRSAVRAVVPGNSQRAAVPGTSPRAAGSFPRSAVPRTSPRQAHNVQQPAPPCAVTCCSSKVSCVSVQAAAPLIPTATLVATTASTKCSQKIVTAQQVKQNVRSARDEWEMSARGKQLASKRPATQGTKNVGKTTPKTQCSHSHGPSKLTASTLTDATPMNTSSNIGERSKSGDDGKEKGSGDQLMQWSAEVLGSGGRFVPPGLTLLSSESSATEHPSKDRPLEDIDEQTIATQQSYIETRLQEPAPNIELQEPASSQQKEETYKSSDAFRQAQKRPNIPQSSIFDVESKKPLLDIPVSKADSAIGQHRSLGDHRESHISPERNLIHRPWQAQEEGRDPHQLMVRKPDRAEGHRDMPHFDRTHEKASHSFDNHEEGQRSRGWGDRMEMVCDRSQETGRQWMQRVEDRGVPRVERERTGPQTRVYDYDHQDQIVSEDFNQHHNLSLAQNNPRANLLSAAVRFDSSRHLPLDLSEQRRLQELSEREIFAVSSRAHSLGREGGLGLDRGNVDSGLWRGQLQRQMQQQLQQQSVWQQLQARPELQASLRNPLRNNWPGGQALRAEAQRTLEMQPHLMDRRFPPSLEGRDPRLGGSNVNFRGDAIQGQFPRGYPPGRTRRQFDF